MKKNKKTKKTKILPSSIHFTATEYWSEIKQYVKKGKVVWLNEIKLVGNSTGERIAKKCVLLFVDIPKLQLPFYHTTEETIKMYFSYEQYPVVLQFIQTSKRIYLDFDDISIENDVYANLYSDSNSIK